MHCPFCGSGSTGHLSGVATQRKCFTCRKYFPVVPECPSCQKTDSVYHDGDAFNCQRCHTNFHPILKKLRRLSEMLYCLNIEEVREELENVMAELSAKAK